MIINCIAVDDEPIALNLIASYIAQTPFLKLAAKCLSAVEALKVIHTEPDIQLIFLDIRMADLSGMELAKILEASVRRKTLRVIFTTAYDQYALESYQVDALDYLLKPFSFVDFSRAAAKALDLDKEWYDEINAVYAKRRKKVFELLQMLKCNFDTNQAGLFVWAEIPAEYEDGYHLSDKVLKEANVFITPGGIFGSAGDNYVRVSLCTTEEKIEDAINRIKVASVKVEE